MVHSKSDEALYVAFVTPTVLDIHAITTFGLHAKPNSQDPIGYFGTGLKMATATLVRNKISTSLFIEHKQYQFGVRTDMFRDMEYEQVLMRRRSSPLAAFQTVELPFTTQLARNWELWMAFRELESNTRDEGGYTILMSEAEAKAYVGQAKQTVTIVGPSKEFVDIYNSIDTIFLPEGKQTQGTMPEQIEVLQSPSDFVFYRSMRVLKLDKPSMFTYNVLTASQLTEDRTLRDQWWLPYQIAHFLVSSTDKEFIRTLLNTPEGYYEHDLPLDATTITPSLEFVEVLNEQRANASVTSHTLRSVPSYKPLYGSSRLETLSKKYKIPSETTKITTLLSRFNDWLDNHVDVTDEYVDMINEVKKVLKAHDSNTEIPF